MHQLHARAVCVCVSVCRARCACADPCFEFFPHLCTVSHWHIQLHLKSSLPNNNKQSAVLKHTRLRGTICRRSRGGCVRGEETKTATPHRTRSTGSARVPRGTAAAAAVRCMFTTSMFPTATSPSPSRTDISGGKQFSRVSP